MEKYSLLDSLDKWGKVALTILGVVVALALCFLRSG